MYHQMHIDENGDAEGNFTVIALQDDPNMGERMAPVGYFAYTNVKAIYVRALWCFLLVFPLKQSIFVASPGVQISGRGKSDSLDYGSSTVGRTVVWIPERKVSCAINSFTYNRLLCGSLVSGGWNVFV